MSISVGQVYLFKEGRDKRYISYDDNGKVILQVSNVDKSGYFEITKVARKAEKFTLVEAKRVIKDIYPEIGVAESLEVLEKFGYGIISLPFEYKGRHELQVICWNLKTGVVGVGESTNNKERFNTFRFTIVGIEGQMPEYRHVFGHALSIAGSNFIEVDAIALGNGGFLRSFIHSEAKADWRWCNSIHLWTYADDMREGSSLFFLKAAKRILILPKEAQDMLRETEEMFLATHERIRTREEREVLDARAG